MAFSVSAHFNFVMKNNICEMILCERMREKRRTEIKFFI